MQFPQSAFGPGILSVKNKPNRNDNVQQNFSIKSNEKQVQAIDRKPNMTKILDLMAGMDLNEI